MKKILITILTFYKKILSPIFVLGFGHACKFSPTCSQYAIEAVQRHGVIKGTFLSVKRFAKCHPFSSTFGFDPVP